MGDCEGDAAFQLRKTSTCSARLCEGQKRLLLIMGLSRLILPAEAAAKGDFSPASPCDSFRCFRAPFHLTSERSGCYKPPELIGCAARNSQVTEINPQSCNRACQMHLFSSACKPLYMTLIFKGQRSYYTKLNRRRGHSFCAQDN